MGMANDENPGLRMVLKKLPREGFEVLKELQLPDQVDDDLTEVPLNHVEVPEPDHHKVVDVGKEKPQCEECVEQDTVDQKVLDRTNVVDEAPFLLVLVDHVSDIVRAPGRNKVFFSVKRFH